MLKIIFTICIALTICIPIWSANAATSIPFTISTSETVNVTGTPRIAVDVGGVTRYAAYTSGTGTSSLTFTYTMVAGDVDLDGVTITSPMQLNGGTIKDLNGNDATLTFTVPNTSNVKVNYPSLGMDFVADADGRYTLNGTIYNDLTSFLSAAGGTFTRASVATYFDSAGTLQTAASGVPRFDYDPVTHAAKGILIEESRTNLLINSSNLSAWTINVTDILTADAMMAPDGTMTAETSNSTGGTRYMGISASAGVTYTYSFFVKPSNLADNINLYTDGPGGVGYCSIIPSTGVVSGTSGTYNSAKSTSIGNGWYRVSMTFTATGTGFIAAHIYPSTANLTGYWGAQVEQGAFATSYIPTSAATVTRAADDLIIPNISAQIGTQTTLFTELNGMIGGNFWGIANIDSGSSSDLIALCRNSGSTQWRMYARKSSVVWGSDTNIGTLPMPGTVSRSAFTYNGTTLKGTVDGGGITNSTPGGNGPTGLSRLIIGKEAFSNTYANERIRKVKIYSSYTSNTQLQLMTQ